MTVALVRNSLVFVFINAMSKIRKSSLIIAKRICEPVLV